MMRFYDVNNGFTLIELLVVMVIIAIVAGLTGPAMYKVNDKFSWLLKKNEVQKMYNLTSYEAFLSESDCKIHFDEEMNKYIFICDEKKINEIVNIRQPVFSHDIKFNHKGFVILNETE